MSLKALHIVFVSTVVVMWVTCAGWAFYRYAEGAGGWLMLAGGTVSLGCAAGTFVYGRYVLKKLKHISYL
ncbi:MAG: hypothetical protein FJ404_06305 [Verrucomicrobia bacterium]|nr:hypothetical protein [Verrucomicrobiota bacterium]